MTPQQQLDRATADGFFLALTMAGTKGLRAGAEEMIRFVIDIASGDVLARESVEEEYQKYAANLGREPTDAEREDYYRVARESRGPARDEDMATALRIVRDLKATGAIR